MLDAASITVSPLAVPSEADVFRKVTWRLLPFLFLLYVVNLIDRSNISIARMQMVDEQHLLKEITYARGAGLFFYLGYILFQVPGNLILMRIGPRIWIAIILVTWGIISSAMMFRDGEWSFACLRLLLGVAEAGFFPGVIFYLSDWFPARIRARAVSHFMVGGVIPSMVGNPLSGFILQYMHQVGGLWVGNGFSCSKGCPPLRWECSRWSTLPTARTRPLVDAGRANLAHPANGDRPHAPVSG